MDETSESPGTFRIYPDWKEVMVYDEGDGRVLRLDCESVGQKCQVAVATAEMWASETPPWAHSRRPLILSRLRAAGCLVYETAGNLTTYFSPDGRIRVEIDREQNRKLPRKSEIRVITDSPDEPEMRIPNATLHGLIEFPSAGVVVIPFDLHLHGYQMTIDTGHQVFWLGNGGLPQPLNRLAQVLAKLPS